VRGAPGNGRPYRDQSDAVVWGVVDRNLATLKREVAAILAEVGGDEPS